MNKERRKQDFYKSKYGHVAYGFTYPIPVLYHVLIPGVSVLLYPFCPSIFSLAFLSSLILPCYRPINYFKVMRVIHIHSVEKYYPTEQSRKALDVFFCIL